MRERLQDWIGGSAGIDLETIVFAVVPIFYGAVVYVQYGFWQGVVAGIGLAVFEIVLYFSMKAYFSKIAR